MIVSNSGRKIFDGHNITATTNYIYNSSDDTSSDVGWVSARSDNNAIALAVTNLAATSLSIRIEGRFDTYNRACEIYSKTITSVHTIDEIINIAEYVKELRVGAKVNNSATPNTLYCGIVNSEAR